MKFEIIEIGLIQLLLSDVFLHFNTSSRFLNPLLKYIYTKLTIFTASLLLILDICFVLLCFKKWNVENIQLFSWSSYSKKMLRSKQFLRL